MLDIASLHVRLAQSEDEVRQAQRLRYDVFVAELGATGPLVDHVTRREVDRFDCVADHLILCDPSRPDGDQIVGTYRLMSAEQAAQAGGFSSAAEYDLAPLLDSGMTVLELGRSCVDQAYRRGPALMLLWQALAEHIDRMGGEVLFGVASFPGVDPGQWAQSLSLLHEAYRAPVELRPKALAPGAHQMDLVAADQIDRKAALAALPPLIKAYLRIGGRVGEGAFIDRAFNTTDVCMVLDVNAMVTRDRGVLSVRG